MTNSRTCPDCQRRLFFMPDGRSLHCDHCGYRQEQQMAKSHPPVAELIRAAKWQTAAVFGERPQGIVERLFGGWAGDQ